MQEMAQQIKKLLEEIEALRKENNFLRERVTELKKRLNLNSSNSSKPQSSDGFKKPAPKSLRQAGENPSGGTIGHKGCTLKQTEHPDKIIRYEVSICPFCQKTLDNEVNRIVKRQVLIFHRSKLK